MDKKKNKSVCFVADEAILLVMPKLARKKGKVGGAETQLTIISKELLERGHDVSFIVKDFGQNAVEVFNGIKYRKFWNPNGKNNLKNIFRSFSSLFRAMYKSNADVFIQRTNPFYTGQVAICSKILGKKFIFFIGSDKNCDLDKYNPPLNKIVKYQFKIGLRLSDQIITQTSNQCDLLKEKLNENSIVIRSLIKSQIIGHRNLSQMHKRIIWVGILEPHKNPEDFIDLASSFPKIEFVLFGGGGTDKYVEKLHAKAEGINNLIFAGYVPHTQLNLIYENAIATVLTSPLEGFPNVILESWCYKVPIVSLTVDPDGLLSGGGGLVSKTFDNMKEQIGEVIRKKSLREALCNEGERILKKKFDNRRNLDKIIKVLND